MYFDIKLAFIPNGVFKTAIDYISKSPIEFKKHVNISAACIK